MGFRKKDVSVKDWPPFRKIFRIAGKLVDEGKLKVVAEDGSGSNEVYLFVPNLRRVKGRIRRCHNERLAQ